MQDISSWLSSANIKDMEKRFKTKQKLYDIEGDGWCLCLFILTQTILQKLVH